MKRRNTRIIKESKAIGADPDPDKLIKVMRELGIVLKYYQRLGKIRTSWPTDRALN